VEDASSDTPDLLVGEIERARRDRRVLVIAAAIGIVSAAVMAMVFILGVLGEATANTQRGDRQGALALVIASPIVSMAIGYAVYVARRRRRRRRS
jgi:Kef-type K+ transport system membrane component KefB